MIGIQIGSLCTIVLCSVVLYSCTSGNSSRKLVEAHDSSQHSLKQFKESANTAVFTTKFVVNDNKPITLVRHDADDSTWEFFSDDKFDDFNNVAMVVGLGQVVKIDSSVLEIADMKLGYYAHRKTKEENWTVEKLKGK